MCECKHPGFCPFYQKEVDKRLWECCRGKSGLPRWKEEFYIKTLLGEPKPLPTPDILMRILLFTKAVLTEIVEGLELTDDAEYSRRLSRCIPCNLLDERTQVCRPCGCFIHLKAKLKRQGCPHPLGSKWDDSPKPQQPMGSCGCGS